MNVEINGDAAGSPLTGTLILNPCAFSLWSGQTAVIGGAELDPGNGQPHFPVKVKITARTTRVSSPPRTTRSPAVRRAMRP